MNPRKLSHKCEYCGLTIPNKTYLKHKADKHNDTKAAMILEELKDLEEKA